MPMMQRAAKAAEKKKAAQKPRNFGGGAQRNFGGGAQRNFGGGARNFGGGSGQTPGGGEIEGAVLAAPVRDELIISAEKADVKLEVSPQSTTASDGSGAGFGSFTASPLPEQDSSLSPWRALGEEAFPKPASVAASPTVQASAGNLAPRSLAYPGGFSQMSPRPALAAPGAAPSSPGFASPPLPTRGVATPAAPGTRPGMARSASMLVAPGHAPLGAPMQRDASMPALPQHFRAGALLPPHAHQTAQHHKMTFTHGSHILPPGPPVHSGPAPAAPAATALATPPVLKAQSTQSAGTTQSSDSNAAHPAAVVPLNRHHGHILHIDYEAPLANIRSANVIAHAEMERLLRRLRGEPEPEARELQQTQDVASDDESGGESGDENCVSMRRIMMKMGRCR